MSKNRKVYNLNLKDYGWNNHFSHEFAKYQNFSPARVVQEEREQYLLQTSAGLMTGEITGRFLFTASPGDFPAVGDWVAVTLYTQEGKAIIHHVLPRKTQFLRKTAGLITEQQILAANFDTIFIVTSINNDFNPRRLERYLTLANQTRGKPVILLSKIDLSENPEQVAKEVRTLFPSVSVHQISNQTGQGLVELNQYLKPGETVVVLGSSGVGKSTLINYFLNTDYLTTGAIRKGDQKGRHTTTKRMLLKLPSGALIIDTPGIRELQLWDGNQGLKTTFADIEELATSCRFGDCQHQSEPGCAVKEAIQQGRTSEERLVNYRKMLKEMAYLEKRQQEKAKRLSR